ncbi:MAG: hypothetical protein SO006_07795, partial [Muribaculaceae bacterium]|nr:hypothetical protein [Muribaculaceae bacterium]
DTHAHIRRMLRHDNAVILIQIEHCVFAAKFASKNAIQKSAFFGRIPFAIAFNIKKMCSKTAKQTKNGEINPILDCFCLYTVWGRLKIEYFLKNIENQSPEIYSNLKAQKSEAAP